MLKLIAMSAALALAFASPTTAQDVAQAAEAPAAASEIPQAVKDACKDDYEKHCNAHDPDGAAARDCMAHAFEHLSDPCVTAILDSPLVEQEQQRLADAQASEQNVGAATDKRKANSAMGAQSVRTVKAKTSVRVAKAKHARHTKYAAVKSKRHTAQRASGPRRSVASHIRRGTGIAGRYVKKYTRFAFARVFR